MKLGFIGLGIMGKGMVQNLLAAGFEVAVFNRTKDKASESVSQGAIWKDSPKAVAEFADIVLTCLTNIEALESVVFLNDGIIAAESLPKLLVDFSTIPPQRAVEISSRLDERGIAFVDAPVSGGDVGARNGTLSIMAGASENDFEKLTTIFDALGSKTTLTGPVGSGQLTKAVNQLVVGISVAAMTEGLLLARESGLNLSTTLEVLSGGAAQSWSLDNYAPRILNGDMAPGFYAKDMLKDLRIALDSADERGVSLPVSSLIKELYVALCSSSNQEIGNHALIQLYDRMQSL